MRVKTINRSEKPLSFLIILGIVLFVGIFGGLYYFLTKPVAAPHEEEGVIVNIYEEVSTCLSKHGLQSDPHDVPYIDVELVNSKKIVTCEVNPYYYLYYSVGDTCILWYNMGEYTYMRHK
ncbi:MAG: hypothetical protein IJ916_06685 [Paludibacteraceae bacterium]|nr:hypothetical protein [Paludibacteraceae bacterium]MBR2261371.1 hypothetical protein [Paludibacteraceae bacterium]MEE3484308.1 hypothetical protein [Bacteroidales bacterium]